MFDALAPKDMKEALPGGNALSFDWNILARAKIPTPWILAGGLNWENVSSNLPSEDITAIAVNCNGTVVYAGVKEQGLFYAVSNSLSSIPLDTTTGVEYGSYRFSDYK